MSTFEIFGLQFLLSLVLYVFIAHWYLAPWLARRSRAEALIPLLLFHGLRHLGLTILVPTVTNPDLPQAWAEQLAYGDLISGALALGCALALRARLGFAFALVWVMNIVGTVDLLNALIRGARLGVTDLDVGSFWYVPTFVVPALLVTHGLMFAILMRRSEGSGVPV